MVQEGGFTAEAQGEALNPCSAAALSVLEEMPVLTFLPHSASDSPMNVGGVERLGSMSIPTKILWRDE